MVVCIDGGDPAYFERGLSDGILPNIRRFREHGFSAVAHGVMPSYTNPNNMSIVTGSPQSVHGISGNYFLDPETGHEHMMNDPVFLRSETLLEKFSAEGARVVAITAKDKLRRLLGRDWTSRTAASTSPPRSRTPAPWKRTASRTCSI